MFSAQIEGLIVILIGGSSQSSALGCMGCLPNFFGYFVCVHLRMFLHRSMRDYCSREKLVEGYKHFLTDILQTLMSRKTYSRYKSSDYHNVAC